MEIPSFGKWQLLWLVQFCGLMSASKAKVLKLVFLKQYKNSTGKLKKNLILSIRVCLTLNLDNL